MPVPRLPGSPKPPSPAAGQSTGSTDPFSELVPGVAPGPAQPWQIDTPDELLPPKVYTPTAQEDRVEPKDAAPGTYDLIEYVPLKDAVARP